MTSVLDRLSKLPKYVKIIATNGIDENTAIIDEDNDKDRKERKRIISLNHYYRHREERLKENHKF
jgi:hypothetical protein